MSLNNDLISRSALLEAITFDRKAAKVHPQEICERFERFCDYAEEVVNDAPAVDAVKVVRCKDCEHWIVDNYGNGNPDQVRACRYAGWACGANGYCLYGEHKMDAEVEV